MRSRMMRSGRLLTLLAVAATLLTGCGAGTNGSIGDVFDGGGIPGGPVVEYGSLVGTVLRRVSDLRILILSEDATGDATRRPVPGTTISIESLDATVTTDALGRYSLTHIPAGDYDVVFNLPTSVGGASATFRVRVGAGEVVQGIPTSPTE